MACALSVLFTATPALAAGLDFSFLTRWFTGPPPAPQAPVDRVTKRDAKFVVSPADWATFSIVPVAARVFRERIVTEGQLAIDETSATPVISPYSGRAVRVLKQAGDQVRKGEPLLTLEAQEMVQTQNDLVAALSALDKAVSQLSLAQVNARRQADLFAGRAAPQRDVDQARADLEAARADHRAAVTALEAVENRLRIIGKTEAEIADFRRSRRISPEIAITAPIDGTIVARKIGPGQYIQGAGSEPVFVIDDLNTLWLNIFVREDDAGRVVHGAPVDFRVMAFRERAFRARIDFISAGIDTETRRLRARATIENSDYSLKQQMFATVNIQVGDAVSSPAVPRVAVIHEGPVTRVWVADPAERTVELRRVRLGIVSGDQVQVLEGLSTTDHVVARGSLFVDQMTAAVRQ